MKPLIVPQHQVAGVLDGSVSLIVEVLEEQPEQRGTKQGPIYDQLCWRGHCLNEEAKLKQIADSLYQPGQRLYLAEEWAIMRTNIENYGNTYPGEFENCLYKPGVLQWGLELKYAADGGWDPGDTRYKDESPGTWRSPATMPSWASRATIEVQDVRIGRLQSVTRGEARASGTPKKFTDTLFVGHWDEHHPPEQAWEKDLLCAFVGIKVVRDGPIKKDLGVEYPHKKGAIDD